MAQTIYSLWKGDTFIDVGTIPEMARRQGVKPSTIRFYGSAVYKKRHPNGNALELIKVDMEEE